MESFSKAKEGRKVLLDTSMLLEIESKKVDVFEEARKSLGRTDFFITEAVEKELKELKARGKTMEKAVKVAEELMEKNGVKRIKTLAENADDSIVEAAGKGMIVASNDKGLRKRIKAFGGRNIYLRKKKFIEIN